LGLRLRPPEANKVANFYAAPQLAKFMDRNPVGKRGAQQTSNAGADDPCNRNAFLLEDFQDSQMSKSPGEAATQSDDDTGRAIRCQLRVLPRVVDWRTSHASVWAT
jgi:hypothetical protein